MENVLIRSYSPALTASFREKHPEKESEDNGHFTYQVQNKFQVQEWHRQSHDRKNISNLFQPQKLLPSIPPGVDMPLHTI